jgi:hypothetical protein
VLRAIFKICYARFRCCQHQEGGISTVRLDGASAALSRRNCTWSWGRKSEEFSADFALVSRRALTGDEFNLFYLHYLCGADWRECCVKLRVDRGSFFHAVYRVQQKLGRVFRELKPYALYPLDEYFS